MNIRPTKEQLKKLPTLYATEDVEPENKIAHIKFFAGGRWTWYAVEGKEEEGDITFFGYIVSGMDPDYDEWGYFSLNELASTGRVERDLYWKPSPVPEVVKAKLDRTE